MSHLVYTSIPLWNSDIYHIAGNFRGRKPSQILWFCGCLQKFSLWNLGVWHPLARHKRAIRESFLYKNPPIRESFLPQKFPAIRYTWLFGVEDYKLGKRSMIQRSITPSEGAMWQRPHVTATSCDIMFVSRCGVACMRKQTTDPVWSSYHTT